MLLKLWKTALFASKYSWKNKITSVLHWVDIERSPSHRNLSIFMCVNLWVLSPCTLKTPIIACWKDKNVLPNLSLFDDNNADSTHLINLSTCDGDCWFCSAWIAAKNPRCSTFISKLFGGWRWILIWLLSSAVVTSSIRASPACKCGLALSCWIQTIPSLLCCFSFTAGMTFSYIIFWCTAMLKFTMGLVTKVQLARFF